MNHQENHHRHTRPAQQETVVEVSELIVERPRVSKLAAASALAVGLACIAASVVAICLAMQANVTADSVRSTAVAAKLTADQCDQVSIALARSDHDQQEQIILLDSRQQDLDRHREGQGSMMVELSRRVDDADQELRKHHIRIGKLDAWAEKTYRWELSVQNWILNPYCPRPAPQ